MSEGTSTPHALPWQNNNIELLVDTLSALVTQLLQLITVPTTDKSPAVSF